MPVLFNNFGKSNNLSPRWKRRRRRVGWPRGRRVVRLVRPITVFSKFSNPTLS